VIKPLKEKVASFIYPSYCIHCEEKVASHRWLCPFCAEQIEFVEAVATRNSATLKPLGSSLSFQKVLTAPCFDEVAKTMAAFMVIQLSKLSWPPLDCICPSPRDPFNLILAKHLSLFLKVPVIQALKLPSMFISSGYRWRGRPCLSDMKVLVVDTVPIREGDFAILEEAAIKGSYYLSFI
jgi:hypothetical protein